MPARIEVVQGDITRQKVDAVVNAANSSLLGGGGVDGAIHRAAGLGLLEECRRVGGCPTGEARLTKGYELPARWVIHTVGPIWRGGDANEDDLLARCYQNSLRLADQGNFRSIAFPAISTGIYGFPLERATTIAVNQAFSHAEGDGSLERIVFVCFDDHAKRVYEAAVKQRGTRALG